MSACKTSSTRENLLPGFMHFGELRRRSEIAHCKQNMIIEESSSEATVPHSSLNSNSLQVSREEEGLFNLSGKNYGSSITKKEVSGLSLSGLSPLLFDDEARRSTKGSESEEPQIFQDALEPFLQHDENQGENKKQVKVKYNPSILSLRHTFISRARQSHFTIKNENQLMFKQKVAQVEEKPSKTSHFQDYICNQRGIIESKLKHLGETNNQPNLKILSNFQTTILPPLNTERVLSFLDYSDEGFSISNKETAKAEDNKNQEQVNDNNAEVPLKQPIDMAEILLREMNKLSKIQPFSLEDSIESGQSGNSNHQTPLASNPPQQIFLYSNPYISPKIDAKKITGLQTPQVFSLEKVKQKQSQETKPTNQDSFVGDQTKVEFTSFHCNNENPQIALTQKKQVQKFACPPSVSHNTITRNNSILKQRREQHEQDLNQPVVIIKKIAPPLPTSSTQKLPTSSFANAVKAQLSNYEQILDSNKAKFFPQKIRNINKLPSTLSEVNQKSDYSKIINRVYKNLTKTLPRSLVS